MKIIITEDQLKTAVFQNAVDMAWKDIADNIKEEDYYTDGGYGDNYEAVTKVEVVNAYKTESYALKGVKIIELAIIIYINTIIDINARLLGLKTDVNLNNQFELLIPLKVDKRKNNNNLTPDVRQAIIDIFKFKKGEISISYLKNNNNKPYVTLIEGNNELSATSNLLKDIKSDDIDTQIYKVFNKLLLKKGKDFKSFP